MLSSLSFGSSAIGTGKTCSVSRCHNLRPSASQSDTLRQAGQPEKIASLPTSRLVKGGMFRLSDGSRCAIFHSEGHLHALVEKTRSDMGPVERIPQCYVPLNDGDSVLVMTEGSCPALYTCDVSDPAHPWRRTELFPSVAPLMLTAQVKETVTAEIPAFTLKSSYTIHSSSLSATDSVTADDAMRDAYCSISDKALEHGLFIQPVMARYRLVGDHGITLYTSAPVIVSPAGGYQATSVTLTASGDGYRQVAATAMSAQAFSIEAIRTDTDDALWNKVVRKVEILVSPQIHPLSAKLPGSSSRQSAGTGSITFALTLPGAGGSDRNGLVSRTRWKVMTMLDSLDTSLSPYSGSPVASSTKAAVINADSACDRCSGSVSDGDDEAAAMLRDISAPHSFTCATASRNGDMIAYGNITAIPVDGYSPPEFAAGTLASTIPLPTASQVNFSDGSSVVSQAVLRDRDLTSLSPLIVYPSPDAVSVTLTAGTRRVTLPLTPTPGRHMAFYLAPHLSQIEFTDRIEAFALPAASPPCREYPSGLLLASAAAPLRPVASSMGAPAPVVDIRPSPRLSNSFTVPSARFYVLTRSGILTMALTDSRRRINLNLLSCRGVESSRQVAAVPGGIAAVTGGHLVKFIGSRESVLTSSSFPQGSMLAWCDSFEELLVIPPGGSEPVTVCSLDGSTVWTRDNPGIVSLTSGGAGTLLVTTDGGILDPSVEESGSPSAVGYTCTVPVSSPPGSIVGWRFPLSASAASGRISLLASHAGTDSLERGAFATLLDLRLLDAAPVHPLVRKLRLPHSHYLTLRVDLHGHGILIHGSMACNRLNS